MNLKKSALSLSIVMVVSIIMMGTVFAAEETEEELIDPKIPESWYEEPQTASEVGIKEFNQSPMLDKRVEEGELPPVKERLPEDPPVIEPYEGVGEYGKTAYLWDRTLDSYYEIGYWNHSEMVRPTPDGNVVPSFIKDWEFSDEHKKLTIHFRKGLKWSDGHEFNAEDIMYYWEHEAQNEELNPTPPEKWDPPLLDVTSEDKWTVTFHYGKPAHNQIYGYKFIAHFGSWTDPAEHFHKQHHPDFLDEEELQNKIEKKDLNSWVGYYEYMVNESGNHPDSDQRPLLGAYIMTERTESRAVWERNPYYPFVDTEGNQLPYVDKIIVNLANESEMASSKATTGEATISARHLQTNQIPLYKKNEEKGDYTTKIFKRAYGSEVAITPNLTHKDKKIRAIFQELKFRKALSLAIDREDINKKVYFDRAIPRQATILSSNKYFKSEYADAYAGYDPERAKELLDEIGIVDRNNDGYRDMPEGSLETMSGEKINFDGESFNPTFMYCKMGPIEPTSILEMIRSDWDDIGLNVDLKMVSRELHDTRWSSNEGKDMSGWTLDQIVGQNFATFGGTRMFAPVGGATYNSFPGWDNWYTSKGESGIEPPEKIKELIEATENLVMSPDEASQKKAAKKLLEAQAENLWMIGTVGLGPQPVIVSNKLKNVPDKGLWDAKLMYLSMFRPEQFYLEE